MGFLGYQAVRLWPAARSNKMKKMQNIKKKIIHYPHKALKVFMWILQQCPWNVDIISKDCYVLISDIASCIWKLPYFPELFKTNLFWTLLLLWLFHFFNVFDIMWFSVPSFHFKLHCFALFVPFFLHNHITEIGNSLFLAFTQSIVYFLNAPFSCHNVTFCCHCLYWCSCNTFNFVKLSVLILNPGAKSLIRVGRVVLMVQGHGRRLAWGLL